jgi:hypothetical protein
MGHIVNPISTRLGIVRWWNGEYKSTVSKIDSGKLYPYYLSIKKFNKEFFGKNYFSKTGLMFYDEKIIIDKDRIEIIIFIQDFKLEKLEWETQEEIKKKNKQMGKLRKDWRFQIRLKVASLKEEIDILNKLILSIFFYWQAIKSVMYQAYGTKSKNFPLDKLRIRFLIWQEPRKVIFLRREGAFQRYLRLGGFRAFGKFRHKSSFEETHLTPKFLTEFVIRKLKQRHVLKDIIRPLMRELGKHKGISGFKITCSGRFSRADRATFKWMKRGRVPLNNFRELVEYDYSEVTLRFGRVGVKIWLCYNPLALENLWKRAYRLL